MNIIVNEEDLKVIPKVGDFVKDEDGEFSIVFKTDIFDSSYQLKYPDGHVYGSPKGSLKELGEYIESVEELELYSQDKYEISLKRK